MDSRSWSFRGAQLDLARQMETLDTIYAFTDFLARHRYNVLALYLEARIRTPTFPWPSDQESYTPADMRRVVAYAGRKGIAVVPIVSTLGHTEQFLRWPQLQHLSETRGTATTRFELSPSPRHHHSTFCTSLPGTWEFFGSYLREVAELFPSRWFHAGADEDWDLCTCPLCRPFARGEKNQSALFARHLIQTHRIVTGQLGKRMMIWDDMLEHYPSALRRLPRDIVMTTWLYDDVVDLPQGHFGNRPRGDRFAAYEALGFDYIVAPREQNLNNIETITRYGARHRPLGGLVTIWEKSLSFMFESYPALAVAGRLWHAGARAKPDAVRREALRALFPKATAAQRDAVVVLSSRRCVSGPSGRFADYLRGPLAQGERERVAANRVLAAVMEAMRAGETHPERAAILEDLAVRLDLERLHFDMRELATQLLQRLTGQAPGNPRALRPELAAWLRRVRRVRQARRRQWAVTRAGYRADRLEQDYGPALERVAADAARCAAGAAASSGLLRVQFCLPNIFPRAETEILVRYAGRPGWIPIARGVFKPDPFADSAYFERWFPIHARRAVAACRLDVWSYGGTGVTFVEAINLAGRFAPRRVAATAGKVRDAAFLVADDLRWCWLGEPDSDVPFYELSKGRVKSSVTLAMQRTSR